MIESMTGYGSGRAVSAGSTVVVWLRSVNSRSFKLTTRLPEQFLSVQAGLEELIKGRIVRGSVYCQVELDGPLAGPVSLDGEVVLGYCRKLRSLAKKAGVPADIRLELLAALPGALKEDRACPDRLQDLLMKAFKKALRELVASRREEGAKTGEELRRLLERTVALHRRVRSGHRKFLREHKKKLAGRVRELLSGAGVKVAPEDIAREAAILAERSDIAEELQRLDVHTQQMAKALSSRKPVGRRIEFIAQEMLREANTMSAKSVSSKLVVPLLELKESVDRIREQAQNVQ